MIMKFDPDHVEVTTRYVTTVNGLADAWSFVMSRIELVGPDPQIIIKPVWVRSAAEIGDLDSDEPWPRQFEVVVEGMVIEKQEKQSP